MPYQLIFWGPQTSKSIAGIHFPKDQPTYLEDNQLPMTITQLRKQNIEATKIDEVPKTEAEKVEAEVGLKGQGVVWKGKAPRYTNDYGTFVRDVPRYDLLPAAVAHLVGKAGFFKVE